jgi:hypothetical protein
MPKNIPRLLTDVEKRTWENIGKFWWSATDLSAVHTQLYNLVWDGSYMKIIEKLGEESE